jgi:hypothetical protein
MNLKNAGILLAATLSLAACAMTSDIEEGENGVYTVSAHAAPIRGGTTGAHTVAYEAAQKFCAAKGGRAIVVGGSERDVYQGSYGGSFGPNGGGFGGGVFAAGNVTMQFRCKAGES